MNKLINKFKYNKVNQNGLNGQDVWLLVIKLIAGTDLNDIEKLVFSA